MNQTHFLKSAVTIVVLMSAAVFTSIYSLQQPASADVLMHAEIVKAPIATSGNNVYTSWSNNDTGHWNVFFAEHRWR